MLGGTVKSAIGSRFVSAALTPPTVNTKSPECVLGSNQLTSANPPISLHDASRTCDAGASAACTVKYPSTVFNSASMSSST